MQGKFERIAIVNRGEAAMRFLHAAREFNEEHGTSLRTIALYTDPDRHAMFVREADEAVHLGPAQVVDPVTHHFKTSYVDYSRLEHALRTARAEAVWVGWGFVAEHAQFADLCRDMGIVFIGPDADAMRQLGDKISSKHLAERAQIPIADWSGGPVETISEAHHHAERLGYPLFIKATAGGGGHGIRRVNSVAELDRALESARAEAFKAFGDPTVFMEQFVTGARHVEVQIIADSLGTTWAVGVRDCTIQRHHQKILEEAPSPALSPEQDHQLRESAIRLSKAAGYHNAGTVEFLYDSAARRFLFMEMNTRLQVEHPVTECTTGLDLVKLQIHVALGGKLEGEPPRTQGHAIEVRLNAEDPSNGFAPAPGLIERFRILAGPGIRVDTGVEEGDAIPSEYDSMIAKVIGFGRNRKEALSRLHRALSGSVVVVRGGASNRSFLMELLARREVRTGEFDVGWLDRLAAKGQHLSRDHAAVAIVQAAIEAYEVERRIEQVQFFATALQGRPQVRADIGNRVALRYRGHTYSVHVLRVDLLQYRLETQGTQIDARLERLGPFEYWITILGRRFHVVSVEQGSTYRIEVDGHSHCVDRDDGGIVRAPSPAVVVSISVNPGDLVEKDQRLAVLEAMKMEMQVVAPFAGKVRQILAIPNVQVGTGTPLVQIERVADNKRTVETDGLNFEHLAASAHQQATSSMAELDELQRLLLGFDVVPRRTSRSPDQTQRVESASDAENRRHCEDRLLNIFVDICSLFRRSPFSTHRVGAEAPSTESYLFSYLGMLDTHGERLPVEFVKALQRALAHYGITSLDRSPELEESLFWIYKSHQRVEEQIGPILALLQDRLARPDLARFADENLRTLLTRMISIGRILSPAVSDLARELRYRCFDKPSFDAVRKKVFAEAEQNLNQLQANPDRPDRHELLRALVECPQPLASLFSYRFAKASPSVQKLMLEVLVNRYYFVRKIRSVRSIPVDGLCCVSGEYEEDGKQYHVFSAFSEFSLLPGAIREMAALAQELAEGSLAVLDLMARSHCLPAQLPAEITAAINKAGLPRSVQRVVIAISAPDGAPGFEDIRYFTYELGENGYEEVVLFRDVHPMVGERLHLWRIKNFDIERLPSIPDVYLLHAVAKENPKDERLFAVAEVRDLTPIRDKGGKIVQLPHLERMFAEAVAAIRMYQSKRPPNQRLYWNRIFLYVWPTLSLRPDEVNEIVHRLAPSTDGLGLEQVVVRARIPNPRTGELRDTVMRVSAPGDAGLLITFRPAAKLQPMKPLSPYLQKVVKMRQRGMMYPYEIVKMLTPSPEETNAEFPPGDFVEYDLDASGHLIQVDRPYGENKSNIILGVIRNFNARYPEGMSRVMVLGDPSKDLGALAEPECRRIIAALDLAEEKKIPLEWFPISAGAKISMDSGVENMDWIAAVLRRIVEFTQSGGEINLVVNGINVGAQPYWNAEATMLMHTRGILIMTPKAAMVLTGKRALDYSGSVSAEDNQGIGGYDRIMGLNGQAQYFARDIDDACRILMRHYEHTYVAPGERFPRRAATNDPFTRDVQLYAHSDTDGNGFSSIGEIFSDASNPGRKKSFDIRKVMMAAIDQDHAPLERFSGMRNAETAVVWDAHLGGYPVCLIGFESKPVPRFGFVPADGPDQWTAGTLFPLSSKKVARAINAASKNRPVVILANLSGFDGSPESMRRLQLEFGAEIGRAVVNFDGPMVFCVISRYHGGAYVVFSHKLNEQLEVAALEGTYASVIGGAPAAAVVFAGEVEARARKDSRLQSLAEAISKTEGVEKSRLRSQWDELFKVVHSEKLGEVAAEFDQIHSVHRALQVGALQRIIAPAGLRPYLVDAVERGIQKANATNDIKPEVAGAKDVSAERILARTA